MQTGWRQIKNQAPDTFPFGPAPGTEGWTLRADAAGIFEVSTPAWGALACVARSLAFIQSLGVDRIVRHRQPLIDYLRKELPKHGFTPLTPPGSAGPVLAFGYKGAARFAKPLRDANIQISIYQNRVRISPSVYNGMEDVDQLVRVLSA